MTATLAEMFSLFRHDAWRLEARDTYMVEGEEQRIADFERTGVAPRKTRQNNGWIATVEDAVHRGATMGRIRLVGHPITAYTAFEFAAYPDNVTAGEAVRAVDRAALHPAWADVPDIWIFDNSSVFVQYYDPDGRFLRAEPAHDIEPFQRVRQMLTSIAVPVASFNLGDIPAPRRGATVAAPPVLPVVATGATR